MPPKKHRKLLSINVASILQKLVSQFLTAFNSSYCTLSTHTEVCMHNFTRMASAASY